MTVALVASVGLIAMAAGGSAAPEPLYWLHVAAGGLSGVVGLSHRRFGRALVGDPEGRRAPASSAVAAAVGLVMVVGASAATGRSGSAPTDYQLEEYYSQLTATNAQQAGNPLFPAGTRIVLPPGGKAPSPGYCGTAGCHPSAYRDWHGSSHERAGLDPHYLKTAAEFARARDGSAQRWCQGCHDPAGLLGADKPPMAAQNPAASPTSASRQERRGIDCISCHAAQPSTELTGNGRMELRLEPNYPFAEHPDPRFRWAHGFLLRLRSGPHRRGYIKPVLHARSELCAPCHRTSYNMPQNQYKFIRTSDDYGSWQASSFSGESVHGFYPVQPARQCQDCHAAHRGGLGTSAPAMALGPSAAGGQPEDAVTVDILALRRQPRPTSGAEELVAPLERAAPRLIPGEAVTIDVVVSNRGVGHQFPAGTGDMTGAWLEFRVRDGDGRTLFRSGARRAGSEPEEPLSYRRVDTPPEAGEHIYGLIALDRDGQRLIRGDLWRMVTPLYHRSILPGQPDLDRRTIQPGESDVVRYRLNVPAALKGPVALQARLWRGRLVPVAAQVALRDRSGTPRLPRVVAEDRVALSVEGDEYSSTRQPQALLAAGMREDAARRSLVTRFYDYGIGLLLQGDLSRAQRVMRRVQEWAPEDWRGPFGLARLYLTEGDLLAARAQFERAAQLAPADLRPRAFLGTVVRKSGQYEKAIALLEPLVERYPRDRLLRFDLGMSHYLSGSYEEAARAFEAILAIDPDDLAAHFNRMRCLRRLRRVPEARQEEVVYEALREDDAAKKLGLTFASRNAWAERETRTIHEHALTPVKAVGSRTAVAPP